MPMTVPYLPSAGYVVRGAAPGVDAYDLIMAQVALAKAAGGGKVYLPPIGGVGYYTRDTIVFDFDYATCEVDDNVTMTRTDSTVYVGPDVPYMAAGRRGVSVCAFLFAGRLSGPSPKVYIKSPRLFSNYKVTIATLGDQVTNYTYDANNTGGNSPVIFSGCTNGRCSDIVAKNGLGGGISTLYTPNMLIERCFADTTQYDNGIQILGNREHLAAVSETDPSTWSNSTIRDCVATKCRNHGIGGYGAVNLKIINPLVYNCGNNGPVRLSSDGTTTTDAGPAGGINCELDTGAGTTFNYRCIISNPRVYNSYGFGIRTNCKGTQIIGGEVINTRRPTAYAALPSYPLWGSAIFVQGAGSAKVIGTLIDGSEAYGYRMSATASGYPTLHLVGTTTRGCALNAALGHGVAGFYSSNDCRWQANGNTTDTVAGSQQTIVFYNTADNIDGGVVQVAGRFEDNYGGLLVTDRVGTVDISKGISGKNNGVAWASANIMISTGSIVTTLHAANISLDNSNGKCARIAQVSQVKYAYVNRRSILGDWTNMAFEAFQINAVTGAYYGDGPTNIQYATYAANFTVNSSRGQPALTLTGDTTLSYDTPSVPPQHGQELMFTFTQDATGGRKVNWNVGWKGATLTGTGTAGQKAVVMFRYAASGWYQAFSSGWLS